MSRLRGDSALSCPSSLSSLLEFVSVNLLLAPLRPLADVLDLTAEALAAVGSVSVAALGLVLAEESERVDRGRLRVVGGPSR